MKKYTLSQICGAVCERIAWMGVGMLVFLGILMYTGTDIIANEFGVVQIVPGSNKDGE